jgi:glycosyltransferase involved in cell wall biosynthesis
MRVLIYEPDHRGHHFVYLAHLLPEFFELAHEVTLITTPTAARSPQFQLHLGALADRFAVDTSIGERTPVSELKYALRGFQQIQQAARRHSPNHIYVPYGDTIAQAVGVARLAGRRPWARQTEAEALLMRGGFQYPAESRRRKLLHVVSPRAIALGPWTRVHHINPDDVSVLQQFDAARPGRFRLIPDPAEPPVAATKSEARRELGLPEGGRYVGCTGGIDRRKGIHLLMRAFVASQKSLRADDRLLLAGPIEPEIRSIIEQEAADVLRKGRILLIDRPLTSREFGLAFKAMDVVATPYPAHPHSASIVIHAAAAGRPVLGSSIGWMERTVREFQLGVTCNVRDPLALSAELGPSLDASEAYRPSEAARRFVAYNSIANFRAHWTLRLRERLNLPPDENLIPWDFVVQADGANDASGLAQKPPTGAIPASGVSAAAPSAGGAPRYAN